MELSHKQKDLPLLFWNDSTPITLANSFLVLDQSGHLAHSTVKMRAWGLKYFFDFIEQRQFDFELLRYSNLEYYRDFLLGGEDPKEIQTAKTYINHVVEFLRWAKDRGEFPLFKFPSRSGQLWKGKTAQRDAVRMPRTRRKNVKVLAPDEAQSLIERVGDPENYNRDAQFQAERNRLLYRVLLITGIRREEIEQFDDSIFGAEQRGDRYSVEILGKGNVLREIILPSFLMDELSDFYSTTRHEHLLSLHRKVRLGEPCRNIFISSRDGTKLAESTINGIFRDWSKRTGIYHKPHMFRHTFATGFYLANRTKSGDMDVLMLLKSLLGHSAIQITVDTYLHMAEAEAGLPHADEFFKLFEGEDE
jgi:Site-specific recombinase XerD